MNANRLKLFFILSGILDLFLFYRSWETAWYLLVHFQFALVFLLKLFLLWSLPISGVLLLLQNKAGLILYYFQFPLKLAFMLLTFGFVLYWLQTPIPMVHKILLGVVIGLETIRLLLNVSATRR